MQNSMYYTTSGLTSLPAYQGGGYLDQYGRQQYGLGKLVKKITKPIASVLDKIIPNEIKPALPYLAAAVPFMLPAGFTMGGLGSALSRGLVSAAASAASQLSQGGAEKRGLNPFTTALSGISGYLSTPSAGMDLGSMKTAYVPESVMQGIDSASQVGIAGSPNITNAPLTIGEKAMNLGLNVGQTASDYLSKGTTAFEKMTGPGDITGKDLMTFGKAIAPGEVLAGTEQAYIKAQDALDKDVEEKTRAILAGESVENVTSKEVKKVKTEVGNTTIKETKVVVEKKEKSETKEVNTTKEVKSKKVRLKKYNIIGGVFSVKSNAMNYVKQAQADGYQAAIAGKNKKGRWVVSLASANSESELQAALENIKATYEKNAWVYKK